MHIELLNCNHITNKYTAKVEADSLTYKITGEAEIDMSPMGGTMVVDCTIDKIEQDHTPTAQDAVNIEKAHALLRSDYLDEMDDELWENSRSAVFTSKGGWKKL